MSAPPTNAQRLAAREPPVNRRQWMHHTWRDLLFLHWRFDPDVIQRTLAPGLTVDTFDGSAWVGIVPFQMRNIRPVFCPPLPGVSNFLELNVRTYAYDALGRPGVWFYSLDANCWPAVIGARWSYRLPYHWARMSFRREESTGRIHYTSRRRAVNTFLPPPVLGGGPGRGANTSWPASSHQQPTTGAAPATEFEYAPRGVATSSHDPESLPFFLIERYFLFAFRNGRLFAGHVHHRPYEVSEADVPRWDTHMLSLNELPIPDRAPEHVAYSAAVDVRVFGLR
jgi:uncharacterized protein